MATRRVLSIATVLFLTIALLPLPALAQGGGHGGGKGRGGSPHQSSATLQRKGRAKGKGRARGFSHKDGFVKKRVEASETPAAKVPPGREKHRSVVPSCSVDPSATPKLHGVENALGRIQRNLAGMQAQVDAGERTSLPAGLAAVVAKFMAWLGITPAPSPTPTPTPEPTITVEPTVTVPPTTP